MIEMSVESVRINLATQQRVVILKALNEDRYLFIWIAHPEAYAIAVQLQGTISPRPLSHDLMKNLIEGMGAKVVRVTISDLVDEIFYSQIVLEVAGQEMEVDARPSDAIALAVRTNAPIFVAEQVLERSGVQVDQKEDGSVSPTETGEAEREQTEVDAEVPVEQKPIGVDADLDTEPSVVAVLTERLAQVEEELRKAQKRIKELESK